MVGAVFVEVAVFLAEVYGYDLVYPSLRAFGDPKARWAYGDSNIRWLVEDPSFPQILCENQVPNCGLCRRSAWVHIGGYRDFGTHENYISEDWDFWIRYLGHGYRGISIRQCLQFYRVTDTGMTASYKPDLDEQRRRLATVNAALISSGRPAPPTLPVVVNPYSNLGPLPQANGAVMLGLPATPTPRAESLFKQWTQAARDRGQLLVVVTSWTTEEAQSENKWLMPDEPYRLRRHHSPHLSPVLAFPSRRSPDRIPAVPNPALQHPLHRGRRMRISGSRVDAPSIRQSGYRGRSPGPERPWRTSAAGN